MNAVLDSGSNLVKPVPIPWLHHPGALGSSLNLSIHNFCCGQAGRESAACCCWALVSTAACGRWGAQPLNLSSTAL